MKTYLLSIFFGYSSTVGKGSKKQTAKRKLVKCTKFVIKLLVVVKNGGETGGKTERNEDGRKWDALNLNDVLA